jgi:hypothetical protein
MTEKKPPVGEGVRIIVADPTGALSRKAPAWARTVLVREADGEVFAPAACSYRGEQATLLACCWEGEPVMTYKRHAFVRLAFLEKEDRTPGWAALYQTIRERLTGSPGS